MFRSLFDCLIAMLPVQNWKQIMGYCVQIILYRRTQYPFGPRYLKEQILCVFFCENLRFDWENPKVF